MIEGRATRSRAVRAAFTSGIATKAIAAALALITISLAVRSITQDAWGLVATLTGIVSLFGFLDFGIGNSLISTLGAAHARNRSDKISELVTNALVFLLGVGALIAISTIVFALVAPRGWLLVGDGVDEATARVGIAVFGLSVAIAGPASLGARIALGFQQGHQNNIVSLIGTAGTFLGVAVAAFLHAPVVAFLAVMLYVPILANAAQSVMFLMSDRVRLDLSRVSRKSLAAQIPQGLPFTLLVLAGTVAYQTDLLVVSYVAGLAVAASYGIALRLFSTVNGLLSGGLQQMWASTAHAIADDDLDWVRKAFPRTLLLTSAVYVFAALMIVVFGKALVSLWLGNEIAVSTSLLVAFAVWSSYAFVMSQLSTLLNGAGKIWPQVITALLMAAANLPLSVFLTRVLGETGPLLGSLISHGVFVGIPTIVMVRNILRVRTVVPVPA